jgi:hypothetical protein
MAVVEECSGIVVIRDDTLQALENDEVVSMWFEISGEAVLCVVLSVEFEQL